MLSKIPSIIMSVCLTVTGCQQRNESRKDTGETLQHDAVSTASVLNPDSAGTGRARGKETDTDVPAVVAKLRKLLPVMLEKELTGADSSARRFVYQEGDLNSDGKFEIWVGFTGMIWCGSGGCTALLLSPDGKLITHFTVIDFPVTILPQQTSGWNDLLVYSGSAQRLLQFDGKTYPKNPSVAPKYKEKLPEGLPQVLAFNAKPSTWYTF